MALKKQISDYDTLRFFNKISEFLKKTGILLLPKMQQS